MNNARWLMGLSCGASGDAVEAVIVEVVGAGLNLSARLAQSLRRPLGRELQAAVAEAGSLSPALSAAVHQQLGEACSAAANQLLNQSRIDPNRILAAGVMSPFAWHEPSGRPPSCRELGSVSHVADRLGVTVVGDFREQDMAAGGQGMPTTALADSLLFRDETESRLLIHFGGTSSLVLVPPGRRVQDLRAFESGPFTSMLDAAIRQATAGKERFDPGGKYAVQGRCFDSLVESWLEDSFFRKKPPKSLPRSAFGLDFLQLAVRRVGEEGGTLQDLLCTLSHFAIRAMVNGCRVWLPEAWDARPVWLSGGGVRNGMLWRLLEHYAPQWKLNRLDELGIPAQTRSAAAAAVLAALTLDGVPASTPSATGAVGRTLGRITPGNPQNWARCLRWMMSQAAEPLSYRAA